MYQYFAAGIDFVCLVLLYATHFTWKSLPVLAHFTSFIKTFNDIVWTVKNDVHVQGLIFETEPITDVVMWLCFTVQVK